MIKINVTKSDIRKGRLVAGKTCGCPIWHALRRALKPLTTENTEELVVPRVEFATFRGFKILLPDAARQFQWDLMEDFSTPVEPFEFDADVIVGKRRKS